MLNYLKIKNLALIANAEVEFAAGFNAVTGESGSGKTVLLNKIRSEQNGTKVLVLCNFMPKNDDSVPKVKVT